MNFLKKIYHTPDAQTMAAIELAEAQREHLQWQSAKEYATRMVQYQNDRIKRLTPVVNAAKEMS